MDDLNKSEMHELGHTFWLTNKHMSNNWSNCSLICLNLRIINCDRDLSSVRGQRLCDIATQKSRIMFRRVDFIDIIIYIDVMN